MNYTVVIPTIWRPSLQVVLDALGNDATVIVVDGSRGPAAARNTGWRAAKTEWVVFLDDDVVPGPDWRTRLLADLDVPPDVAGSQARIHVPLPHHRKPTDLERGTAGLEHALWITADMAYRRSALEAVGGFDERFPRAYREDADLALRMEDHGYRLVLGSRETFHPVRKAGFFASLKAQRGNADDALMRRLHGPHWRDRAGGAPGRFVGHAVITAAAAATVLFGLVRWRALAAAGAACWAALTAEFAARRILPGPRTPAESARMVVTSIAIPPAAIAHRVIGELRHWQVKPPPTGECTAADGLFGELRDRRVKS